MTLHLSPVQTERVSARRRASTRPIKLMLKIGSIHTDRVDARQLICIDYIDERCQFKLYIGYWTSNNNKWPKCSYQTPSPDNTCANDVIDNDVIDSWINVHTLLASRPNVVARRRDSSQRDATRRARCERGFTVIDL